MQWWRGGWRRKPGFHFWMLQEDFLSFRNLGIKPWLKSNELMRDNFYRNSHYLLAKKILSVSFSFFKFSFLLRMSILSSTGEKFLAKKPEVCVWDKPVSWTMHSSIAEQNQIVFLVTVYKCLLLGNCLLYGNKELTFQFKIILRGITLLCSEW